MPYEPSVNRPEAFKRLSGRDSSSRAVWTSVAVALALGAVASRAATGAARFDLSSDPGSPGPYAVAKISVTVANPATGSVLPTEIHYPASDGSVDPGSAPYATVVFSPGTLAGSANYERNARHLASWGYIVVVPDVPNENIEVRASDVQYLISYVMAENTKVDSLLYQIVDVDRLAVTGHSVGGLTAIVVASRDVRVKAVVALDPVNPSPPAQCPWDHESEAPSISAPLLVLGAPSAIWNSFANYRDLYQAVGSSHKAQIVISNGSHCDFHHTDNVLLRHSCFLVCGGRFSVERAELVSRYSTAWFDYYLRQDTGSFGYLYGEVAEEDVREGLVTRDVQTFPQNPAVRCSGSTLELSWPWEDPPTIVGYSVFRREEGEEYTSTPSAHVGRPSSYLESAVTFGRKHCYVARGRDASGNLHQPSWEVCVTLREGEEPLIEWAEPPERQPGRPGSLCGVASVLEWLAGLTSSLFCR